MRISKIILGISLITVLALAACTPQAAAPSTNNQVRQLYVSDTGNVTITPDIAYVNIGVHSESANVKEALDQNNQQAQAISAAIQALGVDAKDIQTNAFNIYPQQIYPQGEFGPDTQPVTTYIVDNSVQVIVRDLSILGNLLNTAVQTGANSINGISFDATNKKEAEAEARKIAIENAKQQAEELAAASGVKLGDLFNIQVYTNAPVPVQYEGKYLGLGGATASDVPVSAGQLTIIANANLTYEIE